MKKQLGFWSVLSLVMGNMIGVGIFVLPSVLAPFGSLSLIAWSATLVGALFLALMFSRISTLFPSAGGLMHMRAQVLETLLDFKQLGHIGCLCGLVALRPL